MYDFHQEPEDRQPFDWEPDEYGWGYFAARIICGSAIIRIVALLFVAFFWTTEARAHDAPSG